MTRTYFRYDLRMVFKYPRHYFKKSPQIQVFTHETKFLTSQSLFSSMMLPHGLDKSDVSSFAIDLQTLLNSLL